MEYFFGPISLLFHWYCNKRLAGKTQKKDFVLYNSFPLHVSVISSWNPMIPNLSSVIPLERCTIPFTRNFLYMYSFPGRDKSLTYRNMDMGYTSTYNIMTKMMMVYSLNGKIRLKDYSTGLEGQSRQLLAFILLSVL